MLLKFSFKIRKLCICILIFHTRSNSGEIRFDVEVGTAHVYLPCDIKNDDIFIKARQCCFIFIQLAASRPHV